MADNNEWVAIVGNGYNDSGSGEAQLYILKLEGGIDGTWTLGTDYWKISTDSGSSGSRNGLSTPAVIDSDGNGTCDRAYAGDLFGDLWAFDISGSNTGQWDVAYKHGSTPKPLFDGSTTQPITVEPVVARHPTATTGSDPDVLVFFGTGQYLVDADKTSSSTQAFYGVWDTGEKELTTSKLVQQTFETTFASNLRVLTDNSVAYDASGGSKKYGWYIELPTSGERVVVNPTYRGSYVYFNTLVPSTDACSYGGSGWNMAVDIATGGRTASDTQAFDIDNDGDIDEDDLVDNVEGTMTNVVAGGVQYIEGIPAESAFLGNYQYTPGTHTDSGDDIEIRRVQALEGSDTGRLSWEELQRD